MTKGILPVVTEGVFNAVRAEGLQADMPSYIAKQLDKMKEENPLIAEFVNSFSVCMELLGVAKSEAVAICGITVYRLLESQAEAEKLDKIFK